MAIPAITNNSPVAGSIAWDAFNIQYNGVGYSIAAGSTAERWVWWRYNGGSSVIEAGPFVPDGVVKELTKDGSLSAPDAVDPTLPKSWLRGVSGNTNYGALHTTTYDAVEGAAKLYTGQTGATGPILWQSITGLEPGTTIQLTYQVKGNIAQTGLYTRIMGVAGTGTLLNIGTQAAAGEITTGWVTVVKTAVVPAGVTAGRLAFMLYNKPVGNTAWVRNVQLWKQVPAGLTDDDLLLFANKSGIGVRVQSTSFVDGELLVDGSILTEAISANAIVTEHMAAGTIDGSRIKAGTLESDRVIVGGGDTTPLGTSLTANISAAQQAYVQSRGMNLIVNGSGMLGNDYNFSAWDFYGADSPGGAGSFVGTPGVAYAKTSDEYIPVDASKTYTLGLTAKQLGITAGGYMYIALNMYDVDGVTINPYNYGYRPGTITTLAAQLNPGDTVVQLTSAANWYSGATLAWRYLQFWNYVDSKGKAWPAGTYTKNFIAAGTLGAWASGGISGNTVTLTAPYAGAMVPAGTAVSNGYASGSYKYVAASNVLVPKAWTPYTGNIGTICNDGVIDNTRFAPGTATVKLVVLANRTSAGASDPDSNHAIGNIYMTEINASNIPAIALAQAAADAANVRWAPAGVTTIDGGKITTDSITAGQIATGAITALELATDSVIANKIKAGEITANKLASHTITANEIFADTITANEIATGTITANEIAGHTITANEILGDTITANEIASHTITAIEILSGTITATELAADSVTARQILAGSVGAAQIKADELAAVIIKAGLIEAGSAVISATLRTGDLTVDGGMTINGVTNAINGQVSMTSGVSTPSKPSVGQGWPTSPVPDLDTSDTFEQGDFEDFLYDASGNTVTVEKSYVLPTYATKSQVRFYDPGLNTSTEVDLGQPSTNAGPTSITQIGTNYYILMWDEDLAAANVWIKVMDVATKTVTATYAVRNSVDNLYYAPCRPVLANDGTNLKFFASGSNWCRMYTYNPAALNTTPGHGYLSVIDLDSANSPVMRSFWGVYIGNADFGTQKILALMSKTNSKVLSAYPYSFNPTTGANIPADTWKMPFGATYGAGLNYQDGYLRYGMTRTIVQLSDQKTAIPYMDWGITWWDSTNPTHETPIGPAANFAIGAREWVFVGWPNIPTGYGALGPNSARVYARTASNGTWYRQAQPGINQVNATYATLLAVAGTTPPAAPGGFAGLAGLSPGLLVSQASDAAGPLVNLKGDGAGRLGPFSWSVTGERLQACSMTKPATFTLSAANWLAITAYTAFAIGDTSMGNATTGIITIPADGLYQIEAGGVLGTAASSRRVMAVDDYTASSTAGAIVLARQGGTSVYEEPLVSRTLKFVAGKQMRASFYSSVATAGAASDTGCYFTVRRVG